MKGDKFVKTESFSLTKNEKEIMNLLWIQNRPLSRSEIIQFSKERTWKASSIHILLNQLLKKGAIKVDGFIKTGKNYGRTFAAAITQEEYQIIQFKENFRTFSTKPSAFVNFVSTLVQDEEIDDETLDRLEAILQAKRSNNK